MRRSSLIGRVGCRLAPILVLLFAPVGCEHPKTTPPLAPPSSELGARPADAASVALEKRPSRRVILFVWDGLRPDSITEQDTPRLAELGRHGARFPDHHATYPTFTMANAASLATGDRPAAAGFYGNTLWEPDAEKRQADGTALHADDGSPVHYDAPAFTEDFAVIRDLDAFYGGKLLPGTLFEAAQERGLTTAAIGKSGPAYLQDRHARGSILDEKAVWPLSLVKEMQDAGIALPKATPAAYRPGEVVLDPSRNGDPTLFPPSKRLADGQTTDPTDTSGAPAVLTNTYMLDVYLDFVLPKKRPDLSLIWFRNPDTAQHWYGPGTPNARRSLHDMDGLLGKLLDKLVALGWRDTTDVLVVSDHGHGTVSGRLDLFPLRAIVAGNQPGASEVGGPDPSGYSVSGDVRLADLLTRIGKFKAFDGGGCLFDPVLSGIGRNGKPLYPVRADDAAGTACGIDAKTGKGGAKYNTPAYRVAKPLPRDSVIVAVNGGSDYLYVPSHDAALVGRVVKFLQRREEVGAIFVGTRYGRVPGTLPMGEIGVEYAGARRVPDIVLSYDFDADASVAGVRGIQYESAQNYRGMHGGFSPADVHNTFLAEGPDFRKDWADTLPTANVDIAPTVARILGLTLPPNDGRALDEALSPGNVTAASYSVTTPPPTVSATASGLRMFLPTDTDGTRLDPGKSKYHLSLQTRQVSREGKTYTYYDWARAVRE